MLFRLPNLKIIVALLPMLFSIGCLDVPDELKEYDAPVDLIAVVASDTMEANRAYNVQISFFHQCGQVSTHLERTSETNKVTMKPMVHINSNLACLAVDTYDTVIDTVRFSADTMYELWVSGRNVTIRKLVHVVSQHLPTNDYHLRFRFQSVADGRPKAYLASTFSILDDTSFVPLDIITDSLGTWDTTFAYSLQQLRYQIAGLTFKAARGIKDDGFILTQ